LKLNKFYYFSELNVGVFGRETSESPVSGDSTSESPVSDSSEMDSPSTFPSKQPQFPVYA
jgi:hypothetical protein